MTELHLHLDGSMRVSTAFELAKLQDIPIAAKDVDQLKDLMETPEDSKTLQEVLERFVLPLKLIQTKQAIERISFELVEDLAKLSVRYAEIRFAPSSSCEKGLTQADVIQSAIQGVKRGMAKYKEIKCGLILCCMRGGDELIEKNLETIEMAKKYLGDVVCAIDLAGAESIFPNSLFEYIFNKANEYNLPRTIHSGEARGAVKGSESVWKALEYGTKRIGHGVLAVEDEKLMRYLVDNDITLEVCVTSNYHTKLVDKIEDHPIKKLYDFGVHVTVNSDNMTVSNTNIKKEIDLLKNVLGFSDNDIKVMQSYAKHAAFLPLI